MSSFTQETLRRHLVSEVLNVSPGVRKNGDQQMLNERQCSQAWPRAAVEEEVSSRTNLLEMKERYPLAFKFGWQEIMSSFNLHVFDP